MGCGCGGAKVDAIVADPQGQPPDEQRYLVMYPNMETEEVTGLDEARQRLFNPETRATETARQAPPMGTYRRIE